MCESSEGFKRRSGVGVDTTGNLVQPSTFEVVVRSGILSLNFSFHALKAAYISCICAGEAACGGRAGSAGGTSISAPGSPAVGSIAVWIPSVAGNGYEPLNRLLDAPVGIGIRSLLALAKVLATSASVGSGIPGGIFTPMLLVGGAHGASCSEALSLVGVIAPSPGGYALVGMAATTAASIHAPLTAAVMIFEVSGDYAMALPLLLATVISTTVSRALGSESIYETNVNLQRTFLSVEWGAAQREVANAPIRTHSSASHAHQVGLTSPSPNAK
jgi:hypothetical protein